MSVLLNMDTGLHEQDIVADTTTAAAGNSPNILSATQHQEATTAELNAAAEIAFVLQGALTFDLDCDLIIPTIAMYSPSSNLGDTTSEFFDADTGSPASLTTDNSDSNSSTTFDLKSLNLNVDTPSNAGASALPRLVIHEQPVDMFRFRYKSEMHGTHGSLGGSSSGKKKTYPSVRLDGYGEQAIIQCTLHQTDTFRDRLHSHSLVLRRDDVDCRDPHKVTVNATVGYFAEFPGMGIIHTAKRNIVDELFEKLLDRHQLLNDMREVTELERARLRVRAENESKLMNLNQVCLCFEAFRDVNGHYERLCEPVYSRSINNIKSALTGELKITRLSSTCCDAGGNADLFLFVEKVGKNNIQVRFFEQDDNEETVWEDFGLFAASDVHHQYAIALRTPPYRNKDIDDKVNVFVQLYRKSDHCYSKPLPFQYKPRSSTLTRKRMRMCNSVTSGELPATLPKHLTSGIGEWPMNDDRMMTDKMMDPSLPKHLTSGIGGWPMDEDRISKEYSTDKMIEDLLNQNPEFDEILGDDIMDDGSFLVSDGRTQLECGIEVSSVGSRIENQVRLLRQQIDRVARTQTHQKARVYLRQMWIATHARVDILYKALSDENGDTAAMLVIDLLADYELAELLNWPDAFQHQFALHTACLFNRHACISKMLRLGADPNQLDRDDNSPLHLAVNEPFPECVRVLCDASCYPDGVCTLHIDATNRFGYTALHTAIRQKHIDMVQTLTAAGASATKREPQTGNTGLHIAVQSNSCDIVAHLLAATDVSVSERNEANCTAQELAGMDANTTNPEIVDLLRTECPMESQSSSKACITTEITGKIENNRDEGNDGSSGDDRSFTSMRSSSNELFDAICMKELTSIFNVDERWRRVADMLNLGDFVGRWATAKDPTLMMFRFAESQGFQLPHVVNIFVELDNRQALSCLDEMIARRVEME